MRGPLEDGIVNISRINGNISYPCNFMLIASMNPCPCRLLSEQKTKTVHVQENR